MEKLFPGGASDMAKYKRCVHKWTQLIFVARIYANICVYIFL